MLQAIGSETQTIPATKPDRLAEALASPLGERAPIAQGISLLKQRTPKVFVLSNQVSQITHPYSSVTCIFPQLALPPCPCHPPSSLFPYPDLIIISPCQHGSF